jgi:uncharacterized membrane protein YidH (DUF202 family)
MTLVALVICLLLSAMGALGVASPSRLLAVVRRFQTPTGLFFVAAIRIVLGLALLFTAPTSRAPELIRILGVVIIVMGIITPFFGLERFRRLLDWWSAQGPAFVRVWAIVALALGLALAYAIVP